MSKEITEQVEIDINLLNRVAKMETEALFLLYERHSTLLYSIILRIVKEKRTAEIVLQNVFLSIWNLSEAFDTRLKNPAAWLARVARNRAIANIRFEKKPRQPSSEKYKETHISNVSDHPDRLTMLSSKQEEILIALSMLSAEQKDLIEHSYFRGRTVAELAETFHLPVETVKIKIKSTMDILRQKLKHLL